MIRAALLALALAGCSMLAREPVAGWPALQVVEHHVPHAAMRDRCAQYVPLGMQPEACVEFNLALRRCDIWFSADFPPSSWIVEHERAHCAGYDHVGSSNMRELLARYKAAR